MQYVIPANCIIGHLMNTFTHYMNLTIQGNLTCIPNKIIYALYSSLSLLWY